MALKCDCIVYSLTNIGKPRVIRTLVQISGIKAELRKLKRE